GVQWGVNRRRSAGLRIRANRLCVVAGCGRRGTAVRWGASEDRHSPPGDLALGQLVDVLRDLLEGDGHDLGLDVAARHEPEYLLGLGLLAVRGADEGDLLEDDLLHAQGGLLAGQPDLHDAPAVPDGV